MKNNIFNTFLKMKIYKKWDIKPASMKEQGERTLKQIFRPFILIL